MQQLKQEMSHLDSEFNRCAEWLQAALDHGDMRTHSLEHIYSGIVSGHFLFWAASNAAMVTEVIHYPLAKHFHVFLAGGDLDTIRSMNPSLERYATSIGCSMITMSGRRGWVRALKDLGYQEKLTTVVKKLDILGNG